MAAEGQAIELNYAEDAIIKEMLAFARKPVSREELDRAKKIVTARRILGLSTVEDVAEDLGADEVYAGNADYGDAYLAGIAAVTARDVMDAAVRYIREDNMTVAKVVPRDWAAKAGEGSSRAASEPMTKATLPNGLRLLVQRNAALPEVSICAVAVGGARVAAPGKAGLAYVAAEMLAKGTKKRSADRVASDCENLGASLDVSADLDFISLSTDCLKADFPRAFELFSDCLANSAVPPVEFDRERGRLYAQVQSEDDDWEVQGEKIMLARLVPPPSLPLPYHRRPGDGGDPFGRGRLGLLPEVRDARQRRRGGGG